MRIFSTLVPLALVGGALLLGVGLDWNADMTWHDQHRIEQIALLVVIGVGGATIWARGIVQAFVSLPQWARMGLVVFACLGGFSCLLAEYPRYAALEWATVILLVALMLLLGWAAGQLGQSFDRWASRLILALAVVIAAKLMASYLAALIVVGRIDSIALFEGTFSNRRFFGQMASLVVPLLAHSALDPERSCVGRRGAFLVLGLWWAFLIASGTRGAWLGLAIAVVTVGGLALSACKSWLRIQLLSFVSGLVLWLFLFQLIPQWQGSTLTLENRIPHLTALNGRAELWNIAVDQIKTHPFLGVGPMHFAAIRNGFGAHPHNALLQIVAEWGIGAGVAMALLISGGVMKLLARLRQQGRDASPLLVSLLAGLLAAIVHSMVDGIIVIPLSQLVVMLTAGWALGFYHRGKIDGTAVSLAKYSILQKVFMGLALVLLLRGVSPEIHNRMEITRAFVDAGNLLLAPRYWAVGWIP